MAHARPRGVDVIPRIETNLARVGAAFVVFHLEGGNVPEGMPWIGRPAETGAVPEGRIRISILVDHHDVGGAAAAERDARSPGGLMAVMFSTEQLLIETSAP
jgi:hypothetical protein